MAESFYFHKIKQFQLTNTESIRTLAIEISKRYDIDQTILYEFLLSEANLAIENNNKHFDSNKFRFGYLAFAAIFSIAQLFLSLFYRFKPIESDLLFEDFWPHNPTYNRFYKNLEKNSGLAGDVYFTPLYYPLIKSLLIKPPKLGNNTYIRRLNRYVSPLSILINSINAGISLLPVFFTQKKINYSYFYLRFVRKYLMYNSMSFGLNVKEFVSVSDYYWDPLKYAIYKQNGVEIVSLFQHNYKVPHVPPYFLHADRYFFHSKDAMNNPPSITAKRKYIYQNIPNGNAPYKGDRFDVCFNYQNIDALDMSTQHGINNKKAKTSFFALVNNLVRYAEENAKKVVFLCKYKYENENIIQQLRKNNPKNINFIFQQGQDALNTIAESGVVVNICSTLGIQAYAFKKKVLWVNYDHLYDEIARLPNRKTTKYLLTNSDYKVFEERLNFLLKFDHLSDNEYARFEDMYGPKYNVDLAEVFFKNRVKDDD